MKFIIYLFISLLIITLLFPPSSEDKKENIFKVEKHLNLEQLKQSALEICQTVIKRKFDDDVNITFMDKLLDVVNYKKDDMTIVKVFYSYGMQLHETECLLKYETDVWYMLGTVEDS